jgi:hypothetical protein
MTKIVPDRRNTELFFTSTSPDTPSSLHGGVKAGEMDATRRKWKSSMEGRAALSLSHEIRVEPPDAIRTNAVREIRLRVFAHIGFNLIPISVIVPDLLAGSTDRQEATQHLDFSHGLLQFCNSPFVFLFHLLDVGYIFEILDNTY